MYTPYNGEVYHSPEIVERTDQPATSPAVNSDAFVDNVPVDATLIHEIPMGGTVAAVGPMTGPATDKIQMFETPNQAIPMSERSLDEIPMGETGQKVGVDGKVVNEAPLGDAIDDHALLRETFYKAPLGETLPYKAPVVTKVESAATLLNHEESENFRSRWNEIQGTFVDDPRTAVQQADALVSEVIGQITQMFASNHSTLESQWKQGNDVSTEDLRKALQHYRSFFNRLVV